MKIHQRSAWLLRLHGRVFLLALLAVCLAAPSATAGDRTVTVGVYENEPKIFTSSSGKPAGIFIDLIEAIAKSEGWNLRYVPGTWAEGLDRLAKGQIDLMPDVAYTAERQKIFAFHKVPALSSWYQAYAPKGSNIQSILDLKGKRILVLERSVQSEAFVRFSQGFQLNSTLVSVPDYQTMFERIAKGEGDVAITNHFYGRTHAKKYGLKDTAIVFEPSDLFFTASKGDPKQLLAIIDRRLGVLKDDSRSAYYSSLKRWTSEEVKFTLPLWLQLIGAGGLGFLLLSLVVSAILKHQVDLRTRELREINQEMEQRIAARTAELTTAMEKAQAADRIKSAFLATMSHELRTPLNSIIGFTGIILQGLTGPLNPEQHKQMTMVQNSSRHLLSLINDVLDISKIEAGQLLLSATSFDLGASIDKMVKLIAPLAEKKGLALQLALPETPLTITADQRRLEQVILNLLSNGVKFTETGQIRIACRTEDDQILLTVTDSGIGILPDDLPKIFQPFHQIDTGLARKHEGTGLGLSICKKIVEMMGGSIEVESSWGQGSTFIVRIPRRSGENHE